LQLLGLLHKCPGPPTQVSLGFSTGVLKPLHRSPGSPQKSPVYPMQKSCGSCTGVLGLLQESSVSDTRLLGLPRSIIWLIGMQQVFLSSFSGVLDYYIMQESWVSYPGILGLLHRSPGATTLESWVSYRSHGSRLLYRSPGAPTFDSWGFYVHISPGSPTHESFVSFTGALELLHRTWGNYMEPWASYTGVLGSLHRGPGHTTPEPCAISKEVRGQLLRSAGLLHMYTEVLGPPSKKAWITYERNIRCLRLILATCTGELSQEKTVSRERIQEIRTGHCAR
jgi:hypothetical protein